MTDPADTYEALATAPQPPAEAQAQGGGEAWQHPDALPPVGPGQQGWFWVAVRRAEGRIYSFPATYLNAMVALTGDNCDQEGSRGNRYHHGPVGEDEGTFLATGWHDAKEHYEYSGFYSPLLDSDEDELIAWRAVTDYGDTAPPSAPVVVDLREAAAALLKAFDDSEHPFIAAGAAERVRTALAQQPDAVEGLADADIKWDMRHIEPHLKDADAAIPVLLQGVRRAIKRALAQAPAVRVTDEMVEAALAEFRGLRFPTYPQQEMRAALEAALGQGKTNE